MINPPHLIFQAGPAREREIVGWTGAWPPPEAFLVLVGGQSGEVAHLAPDEEAQHASGLAELRALGTVTEYRYRRESYSALPDDIDHEANSHVVRAASYVLEDR